MIRQVEVRVLGLMDYEPAWAYQTELFQQTIDTKLANRKRPPESQDRTQDFLLLCEHPHVYTLGKSGKINHLLFTDELLHRIGATYVPINRGGDVTYHGPGQIVGYPILDLDAHFTDIHKYLRYLEEVIIRTLAHYGLEGMRSPGETGVWLEVGQSSARKICAMGIKASRWVTMHGFALNVNTDLSYFQHIVPCGISDKAVTSLEAELGHAVSMDEVQGHLLHAFAEVFGVELRMASV